MPGILHRVLVLLAVGSLILAGCTAEGRTPTAMPSPQVEKPTQPPQATGEPQPTAPSLPTPPTAATAAAVSPSLPGSAQRASAHFPYVPLRVEVKPSLTPYSFTIDAVSNPELVRQLNEAQKELLSHNGFVVVPQGYAQIYDIYKQGKDRGVPLFITTDAVLHAYHILYDYVLRSVEYDHLIADARALSRAMLAAAEQQHRSATGDVKESARIVMAYFAVAARLIDSSITIPAEVRDVVQKELALIEAHQGYVNSPLFGFKEDYSQYAPRGHYTRNDQFKAYFKAMMWYGRIGFRLKPGTTADDIARGREETRCALLVVSALEQTTVGCEPALAVWDRIYEPTAFFVGSSDDLTVYDYQAVAAEVYGHTPALRELSDVAKLDAFIAEAMKLRSPRIVSSYVTDREKPEVVTKSFRFMGQRFIPDSYIFQQLVYDKVGTRTQPRLFPKGLDVLAVFGSQRAYEILDKEYKQTAYARYGEQMSKLRSEFAALSTGDWTQNLYWGWLYALLPLTKPAAAGYPSFMQTQAWTDKQLNTALGSWAELRHDTILYAKQSTTLRVTSIMPRPQDVRGYVEPIPDVYARLAALAAQTRQGLQTRGLLAGEYADKLAGFERFLQNLETIAEKELGNQPLTDDEYGLIREVGAYLQGVTTFSVQEANKLSSEADQRMAVIADVHTDTNSNQALEEGVGDAFPIYVLVPIEGALTLAQGGVFSYYEFTVPLERRLTDEQWQQMTPKPELPVWTQSFIR